MLKSLGPKFDNKWIFCYNTYINLTNGYKMTIATQLPKNLITEAQILNEAYKVLREQVGSKSARYHFYYDQDFISDIITEYRYLQLETTE